MLPRAGAPGAVLLSLRDMTVPTSQGEGMPDDAIDAERLRRVLVTKLRHHGDVLLASPVISVLKRHAPQTHSTK